jgi:hypothetical protein
MNGNHEPDPTNLVRPEDACPNCGERDCDRLVWLDDERVQCQCCQAVYEPRANEAPPA